MVISQGGVDHGFPVLISEIYEGLPAARCGGLGVGDAILAVNGTDLRCATHAQAVHALTEAVYPIFLLIDYILLLMPLHLEFCHYKTIYLLWQTILVVNNLAMLNVC